MNNSSGRPWPIQWLSLKKVILNKNNVILLPMIVGTKKIDFFFFLVIKNFVKTTTKPNISLCQASNIERGRDNALQESEEQREEARQVSSCAAGFAFLFTQVKQDKKQETKLFTSTHRVSIFQHPTNELSRTEPFGDQREPWPLLALKKISLSRLIVPTHIIFGPLLILFLDYFNEKN